MKALRLLLVLTLLAGACLTGRAVYLRAKAALAAVLIREAWDESVRLGKPRPPWPWADTYPVARLRIPRLRYDEIVLEGATPRTLAFGPARLRSGASPGEPGNLILAGHRTSWFRPIESLATGDTIEVEWFDARRGLDASERGRLRKQTYTVDAIAVVSPEDVSLLAPTPDDVLTLVTCYPFGHGPRSPLRYVVRASPLDGARSGTTPPGRAM